MGSEAVTPFRLIEKGFKREWFGFFALAEFPFEVSQRGRGEEGYRREEKERRDEERRGCQDRKEKVEAK